MKRLFLPQRGLWARIAVIKMHFNVLLERSKRILIEKGTSWINIILNISFCKQNVFVHRRDRSLCGIWSALLCSARAPLAWVMKLISVSMSLCQLAFVAVSFITCEISAFYSIDHYFSLFVGDFTALCSFLSFSFKFSSLSYSSSFCCSSSSSSSSFKNSSVPSRILSPHPFSHPPPNARLFTLHTHSCHTHQHQVLTAPHACERKLWWW